MWPKAQADAICQQMECLPGINNVGPRIADMDAEGVDKQLLFPQRLFGLFFQQRGDIDLRGEIFRCYNEYMSEVCSQAPGRLYFVAIPNYWEPENARASIQQAKALGASALMVPINPRQDAKGRPIRYNDPAMDQFWAAVAESGLPLCFHIGENIPDDLPGAAATYVLGQFAGFRSSWGTLVYSGLFDRHPDLKVVFVEAAISWVASMLHDADMIYAAFPPVGANTFGQASDEVAARQVLKRAPSSYWFSNCYATFMTDPAGLELLHRIGPERVMWAADYPHSEGTFGYLGKSFLTTISPWIVTAEALRPFRTRPERPQGPPVPPHLEDDQDRASGSFAISFVAELSTEQGRAAGVAADRIVATSYQGMSWTFAQMVAHLTSGGAPLQSGELIGSGTISGDRDEARACMGELTELGRQPLTLATGEARSFLEDGDELTIRGKAQADGFVSIGFGECAGRVAPA